MNKTCGTLWSVVAVVLLMLLLVGDPAQARRAVDRPAGGAGSLDEADPNATKSLIAHDIGNVRMTLANWGEMGNPDGIPGYKGFEFPINSGSDFLFSAGVWVGAQVNGQRLVSTTTDGDNGTNEFYPVHIGTVPFSRASRDADWYVTSKSLATFNDLDYVMGAKGLDDDGDWDSQADDQDHDGRASSNWDGGKGFIGQDDDGDGAIDEEIADGLDDDGDGLIDEDTNADSDHNGDLNAAYDPERHIDEDPAGDISSDYIDNDFDGLVDAADPDNDGDQNVGFPDDDNDGAADEDGVARGGQEYYTVYHDDIPLSFVGSPDNDGHTPLHIQMLQRSYAFPEQYAGDFILIDYRIRNVGVLPLDNVYIAMFSDPDIGAAGEGGDAASLDDYNYYDPPRLMMLQYDTYTDADGPGPGIFAIRVVQTPVALDQLRVSFRNFERVSGGDPENNAAKYDMISSGTIAPPTTQQGDWRMLIGFGAEATNGFRLMPGQELPITMALIAGADTTQGGVNAEWALRMYKNDFQGPSAPNTPEYALRRVFGPCAVRWSPNAETSIDAITNEADFEGYIVERSTDQINWETIAAYDSINLVPLDFPFEWENFNLGMPRDTLWNADSSSVPVLYLGHGPDSGTHVLLRGARVRPRRGRRGCPVLGTHGQREDGAAGPHGGHGRAHGPERSLRLSQSVPRQPSGRRRRTDQSVQGIDRISAQTLLHGTAAEHGGGQL